MAHPSFIPDDRLTESLLCAALARMLKFSLTSEAKPCKTTGQGAASNRADAAAGDTYSEEMHTHRTVAP
jgi:hypothetical protein